MTDDNQTGQVEDPELSARFQAEQLKNKQNLSIAERLIVASSKRKFSFEYLGEEITMYSPTSAEYNRMIEFLAFAANGHETEARRGLAALISELMVDDSFTPELLGSGAFGNSFYGRIIKCADAYEKELSQGIEDVRCFREIKAGAET